MLNLNSIAPLVPSSHHDTITSPHHLVNTRPLPESMIAYARSDTAYMHYLYDRIRRDLWKAEGKEGVEAVLNASRKW